MPPGPPTQDELASVRPPAPSPPVLRGWVHLGASLLILAAVFGPRLRGEYVWDDVYQIEQNPTLRRADGWRTILRKDLWAGAASKPSQLYHPLPMLTFWLQTQLTGLSIVAFRVGNLLLHACCCTLLFVWLRRVGFRPAVCWLVSWVVLLHPSVTEPVMWLTGRHDLLAALFCLAALHLWRGRGGWRSVAARIGAALCCGAAVASKEPYLVAPALLALADELLPGAEPPRRTTRILWLVAPVLSVVAVFALRRALGIASASDQLSAPLLEHLRHFGSITSHYLGQSVSLTNGQTTASYRPLSLGLAALVVVAEALAVGLLAWLAARRQVARALLFGGLWFLLALAPHVLSLPLLGMFGNRYLYFALFGLAIALAAALDRIRLPSGKRSRVLVAVAAVALLVGLGLRTSTEARSWRDDLTLYGADLQRAPLDPQTLYHFGHAVRRRHGCAQALRYVERASEVAPRFWRAWHNRTGCLLQLGRHAEAVQAGRRAVASAPLEPRSRFNLGLALVQTGQLERGRVELQRALALQPDYAMARRELERLGSQGDTTRPGVSPPR